MPIYPGDVIFPPDPLPGGGSGGGGNPGSGNSAIPPDMERISPHQFNLIGKETTRGTAVNPTQRVKSWVAQFNPVTDVTDYRYQGDLLPGDHAIVAESSEAACEGFVAYDEAGLLYASVFGKPVTTTLAAGVFRHQFNFDPRGLADVQTYTVEYGDEGAAERTSFAVLTDLGHTFTRKTLTLSGKFAARRIADLANRTVGANCQQTLGFTGTTTVRLRFNGADTATLTVAGLTASALQTALTGLASVGAGNLTVAGAGPFTATFGGTLGGSQQPLIEVVASTGTAPTVAYVAGNLGGYTEWAATPVLPGQISCYSAASLAALPTSKIARLFGGQFNVGNRFDPFWVMDDAQASWAGVAESPMTLMGKLKVQADDVAQAMATDARNRVRRYVRWEAVGPEVAGGIQHRLTWDMSVRIRNLESFSDEGQIFAREFETSCTFDPAWGRAAQISLVNGVAAY